MVLQVELPVLGGADERRLRGAGELQDGPAAELLGVAHADRGVGRGDLHAVAAAVAVAGLAPAGEGDLDAVARSAAVTGLPPAGLLALIHERCSFYLPDGRTWRG